MTAFLPQPCECSLWLHLFSAPVPLGFAQTSQARGTPALQVSARNQKRATNSKGTHSGHSHSEFCNLFKRMAHVSLTLCLAPFSLMALTAGEKTTFSHRRDSSSLYDRLMMSLFKPSRRNNRGLSSITRH